MTNYNPQPGTVGLTQISGGVGLLIRIGQLLNGNGFANYQHAFVYLGNGKIIEAEVGRARIADVTEYSDIYWCENIAGKHAPDLPEVVFLAPALVGTPYSFMDYFALAARRLHLPLPWLKTYVAASKHMICSQLCAWLYEQAGAPLYPYWTGWVTPLDLYNLDRSLAA